VDDKGHEHIIRFGLESWWLNDAESYISLLLRATISKCWRTRNCWSFSVADAYELRDKNLLFDLTVKAMDKQASMATQRRIHSAISMTAEERYDELVNTYPQSAALPQNMIASYLGLSPETLSRIRKNSMSKYTTIYRFPEFYLTFVNVTYWIISIDRFLLYCTFAKGGKRL